MLTGALFILDSDYDSLVAKGVISAAMVRDEDGLFGQIYTAHPFAQNDRMITLSDNHTLIEFRQNTSAALRPILWVRHLSHLIKVSLTLAKLVRRRNIAIVRAQDPYFCGFVGWIVSQLGRARFCVSIHTDYDRAEKLDPVAGTVRILGSRGLAKILERFILRRAQRVLAISTYIGDYAQAHGVDPEKIRIFRHRVDLAAFFERPNTSAEQAHRPCAVIAVVSRLTDQKHIMDIPNIVVALKAASSNFVVEIAGDGEAREKLEDALDAAGVREHVRLLGFQDRTGVRDLLQWATVYLSLCSGAALIEAGACGKPVVAYDWEWHSELVRNGETGFLTPENGIEATAEALARLLVNPALRARIGCALRSRTIEMFDDSRLVKEHRSVYLELLNGTTVEEATRYTPSVGHGDRSMNLSPAANGPISDRGH